MSSTLVLPEEVFRVAHVDPVVLPSNLLKVQGNELRLVAVDSLRGSSKKGALSGAEGQHCVFQDERFK